MRHHCCIIMSGVIFLPMPRQHKPYQKEKECTTHQFLYLSIHVNFIIVINYLK